MSSSGQATDLSMDEILASIRKIISEDPKPAPAAAPARAPATDGMLNAAQSARSAPPARPSAASSGDASETHRTLRMTKPALDDDILDLDDEERAPATGSAAEPAAHTVAGTAAPQPSDPDPPARSGLNDMWTPRQWPKPAAAPIAAITVPQAGNAPPGAFAAVAAADPAEARLEAAMAALGQSLATPQQADLPPKPIVVATAPKASPPGGPRIDVVAVVNAATRAALAQRSADEQMAMPVSAMPLALPPATPSPSPEAAPPMAEPAAVAQPALAPVSAAKSAPSWPPATAPGVAPAVNAAVEAAVAAARTAPVRADVKSGGAVTGHSEPATAAPMAIQAAAPPTAQARAQVTTQVATRATAPSTAAHDGRNGGGNTAEFDRSPAFPPAAAGVQTLEDTVARLLRPMLRQWLDDNMPRIVEKAFKEELAAQAAPPLLEPRKAN
jgi:cell pole-organizing protein PopZ